MLTTIRGVYEQGHIILKEAAPVTVTTEVMITFLTKEYEVENGAKRLPGGLTGRVNIPDNFNEPLEDLKDYM